MKKEIENTQDIKFLVDSFYNKVKEDELLSPIFNRRITGDWQHHLDKMYQFWNAALLGLPGYKGAPFVPHSTMAINEEQFTKWLQLFGETLQENFSGPLATDALQKAKSMAAVFLHKLNAIKSNPKMIPLV